MSEVVEWRQFGDEWVVFLADAGVLTCLDAFNAAVLDAVEQGAETSIQVASTLASGLKIDMSEALVEKVDVVLLSLANAGLVCKIAA